MVYIKQFVVKSRNKIYPQFTDHYFTGEYPVELVDQMEDKKVLNYLFLAENLIISLIEL